jgi:predicted nucleotidyltransferase
MNEIRSDLPKKDKIFFNKLRDYLDTPLYFYGSVTRSDYVDGKSDIDVAIFTDNEASTITKLQHFLHVNRNAFDKVVWKLNGNLIYGYKIKCGEYVDNKSEIAIYNNEFKPILMEEMNKYNEIPFYFSILLFILKTFHYTIPLLPGKLYAHYKRELFNKIIYKKESVFFVLQQK